MPDQPRLTPPAPERIDLGELVGRAPVAFDLSDLRRSLTGRRILVTGAAGSIGQNLAALLLSFDPQSLILLDHHEHSLFQLLPRLRHATAGCLVAPMLADVRDRRKIARICQEHRPEIVFHLAAYKHVHIGEDNPDEVVDVNLLGTLNLVEESVRAGVRRFVYPSTDKAVDPCNVYGGTKRLVELLLGEMRGQAHETRFQVVRLVNTVGAYGGVIQVFAEQIARGQPITVTHPEMTRFWISMDEAAQFLAFAACADDAGQTLVLNMGDPVRLLDVATRLWKLLGARDPLRVTYVGLRTGERLHERIAGDHEELAPTRHPGVLEVCGSPSTRRELRELLDRVALMREQIAVGDLDGLRRQVATLVAP